MEDVEAIEQIAAELVIGHCLAQVAVSGGNQTDVDMDGTNAAQALEFVVLQDTEQLGLKLHGDVPDFIEEDGAFVGEFETTDFLGDGAGESTLS